MRVDNNNDYHITYCIHYIEVVLLIFYSQGKLSKLQDVAISQTHLPLFQFLAIFPPQR